MSTSRLLFVVLFVVCVLGAHKRYNAVEPDGPYELIRMDKRSINVDDKVSFFFALAQRNMDKLKDMFWRVSDPKHSDYAKYLSHEEVIDMVAPIPQNVNMLIDWLKLQGEDVDVTLSPSKDFLTVKMLINTAERALNTAFLFYRHARDNSIIMNLGEYSLPMHVSHIVDFVHSTSIVKKTEPLSELGKEGQEKEIKEEGTEIKEVKEVKEDKKDARGLSPAPIPIFFVGYNGTGVIGIAFTCPSGVAPTISSTSVLCGTLSITSYSYTLKSVSGGFTYSGSLSINAANTAACTSDEKCNYGLGTSGVAAGTLAFSEMLLGQAGFAPNYVDLYQSGQIVFSDGSNSMTSANSYAIQFSEFATPSLYRRLSSIPSGATCTNAKNSQGILSAIGESFSYTDLALYYKYVGSPDYSSTVKVVGQYNGITPTSEASLDIQLITSIGANCPTYDYTLDPKDQTTLFFDYIVNVLGNANPPLVNSLSYVGNENSLSDRINSEFVKAAVRGFTIIVASGDNGAFSPLYLIPRLSVTPLFPASSPYVTSVGATQLSTKSNPSCTTSCSAGEIACSAAAGSLITSGGGFSNLFEQPAYQAAAVNTYVQTYATLTGANIKNRVYPDVSMNGNNVPIVVGGSLSVIYGTSASAPAFAGLVSLLNDARLNAGKPPLGFLNPFLYSAGASAFNDIVVGDNLCYSPNFCSATNGYSAAVGYDAVTGLGTPQYSVLASAALALPGEYTGSTIAANSASLSSTATVSIAATSNTGGTSTSTSDASAAAISLVSLLVFVLSLFL